jgi:sterol desaturase/sphingolipid hydroxylase (fatty acid hydroxylase superfamily)
MHVADFIDVFLKISIRYFILAGIAFFLLYVLLKNRIGFKKIQSRYPAPSDYQREILFSILTMLIFTSIVFALLKRPAIRQHTTFYTHISDHGWLYFWLAFPLMFFMHDAYFYFTHRLIHHKKLFKIFHLVHHKSTNPSPWAAYAFHPLEAFVEAGIFVIFLFTIPIHLLHIGLFFLFMIVYNIYGHTGWEMYPKGFNKHWLGRWVNTSVNHNQHHQYFKGNYGLYTLIWDRLFGTVRQDYDQKFEEVKNKRQPLKLGIEKVPELTH